MSRDRLCSTSFCNDVKKSFRRFIADLSAVISMRLNASIPPVVQCTYVQYLFIIIELLSTLLYILYEEVFHHNVRVVFFGVAKTSV